MKTPQLLCSALLAASTLVGEAARAEGAIPPEFGSPRSLGCNENDFDFEFSTGAPSRVTKKEGAEWAVRSEGNTLRDRKSCSFRFMIWVPEGFRVSLANLRLKGSFEGLGSGSTDVIVRSGFLGEPSLEKSLRMDSGKTGKVDELLLTLAALKTCGKGQPEPFQFLVNMIARQDAADSGGKQFFSFEALEWTAIQYERCPDNEL